MKDSKDLYQHFSAEDRTFIDKGLELIQRVEDTYALELTSFLNPHQAEILKMLGNGSQLQTFVSSDYFPSELVRVILAPAYYELDLKDFEIELLDISYASKFHQLSHAQIMGTLLHQLGIDRRIFGDILLVLDQAQLFVDARFSQFFIDNVSKIARTPVRLKRIGFSQQIEVQNEGKTRDVLVSSMRLDKLVAASFRLSRSVAAKLISAKQVKLNYAILDNPSQPLQAQDLVSVRGYGRFKLIKENGFSKNGKIKLTVEILSSK